MPAPSVTRKSGCVPVIIKPSMGLDLSLPIDDRWLPKSILCLRDYNLNKFSKDVIAGVTVGLVALPLAMAFAIASGLTPQAGIYCAVVTGFLISLLGGSKHWRPQRLRGRHAQLCWQLAPSVS